MTMKNPPHPGAIIRDLCIDPLNLTVTQAAEGLGVTRKTLSQLLNGHAGISLEMAIRLSRAFGRSPESWLQSITPGKAGGLNGNRSKRFDASL